MQFYDSDEFLVSSVGRFLCDGVRAGQPALVIATALHRKALAEEMRRRGIEPMDLHPSDFIWLDAQETLSAFMEGSRVNVELFNATVGNVFEKLVSTRRYVLVRAYGEMVDILWRDGKCEAALELEEVWNNLGAKYSFSLLCSYAKSSFVRHAADDSIDRICGHHTRVLPSA